MAISINSSQVKITSDNYSLSDIYDYAVQNNKTNYVKKLGDCYVIETDLIVESGSITDTNISLTVNGNLFQIYKGAFVKFGEVRTDLSTLNGCYISCPNIKNAYGFGSTNKSNSGNLFLYGSVVNIYGFWGFFNSDTTNPNHVEVIDCQVDGFGRIEGSNSILKNINFKKSHGRYGILSPKGTIKELSNLSVYDSKPDGVFKCSVYHNPTYANDLTILGGIYAGYDKLAYIEDTTGGDTLRFIDSEIRDGYNIERETNNVDLLIDFTFAPIIRDNTGNFISGARVKITDANNVVVFNNLTDPQGKVSTTLNYMKQDRNEVTTYSTPHTIEVSKDDVISSYSLFMDKTIIDFPMYLQGQGTGSGTGDGCDCTNIQNISDNFEARLNTKINLMESGIRQLIGNVVDEVNENETYFKETGFTIMM